MPLRIDFDNSGGDIHIIIQDGCRVLLDPNNQNLGETQKITSQQKGLVGFLLYENIFVLEQFHLNERNSRLRIYCPTCETGYFITKEEYDIAYRYWVDSPNRREWWQKT